MGFIHGKNAKILVNDKVLTSYFKEYSVANTMDTAETSSFGSDSKGFVQGLTASTVSLSGMYDGAADAVDEELSAAIGATQTSHITISPSGSFVVGRRILAGRAWESSYQVSGSIADIVAVSAEFTGDLGFRAGVSLHDHAVSTTVTGNDAPVDNAAATTNGAVLVLHVTANTRDGISTVLVQDSADGSTWATLATFAAVPATTTTSEAIVLSGTVRRHTRVTTTLAGTTGGLSYTTSLVRL